MNKDAEEKIGVQKGNDLLRFVISLVCLFAADVQFLLSLKLIFIDKEFATLGLSLVLFIAFLLPFLVLDQKVYASCVRIVLCLVGPVLVGLIGGLLIGLLRKEVVFAIVIGVSSALFGMAAFAISRTINALSSSPQVQS